MRSVAIFGAGGLGAVVYDILVAGGRFAPALLVDRTPAEASCLHTGLELVGSERAAQILRERRIRHAVVAIGETEERARVAAALAAQGIELVSAIHPSAAIAGSARLGDAVIIGPRATVCVHARVDDLAIVSTGAIVEHDNRIGVAAVLHPAVRLAGGVEVGPHAVLGIGACVIPGRKIGERARVEPGSVVIRDVLPGDTVGGVPATRRAAEGGGSRFVIQREEARAAGGTLSMYSA